MLVMFFCQFLIDLLVWAAIAAAYGMFLTNSVALLAAIVVTLLVQAIIRHEGFDPTYIPTAMAVWENTAKPGLKAGFAKAKESWNAAKGWGATKRDALARMRTAEGRPVTDADFVVVKG